MDTNWSWYLLIVVGAMITDAQHPDGPVIIPNDTQVILQNDQNFTLICKGKRPVNFKIQESAEELIGDFAISNRTYNITDDTEYLHRAELHLAHVNEFAVGYYACYDDTVNATDVLSDISEEQKNTEHVSFLYVYVNGTESLLTSLRHIIIVKDFSKFVIGCRPTTPDIEVTLISEFAEDIESEKYDPKIGFTLHTDNLLGDAITSLITCVFLDRNTLQEALKEVFVQKSIENSSPKPRFYGQRYYFEGETFSLNCTVKFEKNSAVMLEITTPNKDQNSASKRIIDTNEQNVAEGVLYRKLTVVDATKEDAGTYVCTSKSGSSKNSTLETEMLTPEQSFINLTRYGHPELIETEKPVISLLLGLKAYPPATLAYMKNGYVIPNNKKYQQSILEGGDIIFKITNLTVYDTANYTIIASNKYVTKDLTFDIRVTSDPIINFGGTEDKRFIINTRATLLCKAYGYPVPRVTWSFKPYCNTEGCEEKEERSSAEVASIYEVTAYLNVSALISGEVTCMATNSRKSVTQTKKFIVYELENGFGITDKQMGWFSEYDDVTLKCLASKFDYDNVTWMVDFSEGEVYYSETPHSFVAELKIPHALPNQASNYTCVGHGINGKDVVDHINITVEEVRFPVIIDQSVEQNEEVNPYQPVKLYCEANAVPPPQVFWYKEDVPVDAGGNNTMISSKTKNYSTVESYLSIIQMQEENKGTYKCVAKNGMHSTEKFYNVMLKEKSTHKAYLSIIGVIFLLLLILMVYLIWKIRKEKQFRKELHKAGLLHFKEGATHSLNPDLAIDDQAELLPYDEKFEFPPEKLTLGKQLGSGAYGVVYKAEARGIINAEVTTTVAVKMVKKTADNMYIKALISELKIMVHLGKHINILNLLGACTKNVGKRELNVIMEYCKFGSIDIYMKQHRDVFIDQLTDGDKNGFGRINRGFSCSSGNSGSQSDYFGSNHTQATDHTFLTTGNTGMRKDDQNFEVELHKESESEYVQAEWRSNYVVEYEGRILRPLYSRDLLCWAFQIARGMEYLASRKVLHGDLAARNILLAEDNVVKICDFGLAKSIYKNDEYQKKGNIPLPVKWLAIECITDRTFSTQSDVWAFGIVLWELFTLAKTPYPNLQHTQLLTWLLEGNRLSKPRYADDRIYALMLQCWEQKPTARPTFSQLQEAVGSFLEDSVRNHYVDLNTPYLDMNAEQSKTGQEDYLAMASAPDYNNVMRPRYTNADSLLHPSTPGTIVLQHDEEGYLQMSPSPNNQIIFSPRPQAERFDFDARRLNVASDASNHGSELTPMLTLNNLPARGGSESDEHEGNTSPYLNACPRIEEEADEVFETKQNLKNHNRAVTNPTYIAYDVDKKPQDISYANIPNGLVN